MQDREDRIFFLLCEAKNGMFTIINVAYKNNTNTTKSTILNRKSNENFVCKIITENGTISI